MKNVYNLARGTARIEISGAEPQKILNACCENGIEFWDTQPKDGFGVLFTVHASALSAVRRLARRNNCEMRIVSSKGGKAIGKAAKRRFALLAGIAVCILAVAVSSMFVWNISVSGNCALSYGQVVRMLEECGITYGCFWPNKNSDEVKTQILMSHPEISWLSINLSNSNAEIVVHERKEKPEIINEAEPCDIRAEKNGVITRISVLEGQSSVQVGDTVCRGDLLISGTMQSETAEERRVHALGDVEARTWYELSAVSPLNETVKNKKDGGKMKLSLLAGKNRINFYSDSRNKVPYCDKINKIGYLSAWDTFVVPVGFAFQRETDYECSSRCVNAETAEKRMRENLLEELRYRIGGGEIVSSSFTATECDGLLIVTLRAECLENIAEIKE